ncbi:hypothetical protein VFPFJ_06889 [Purpureocillium lilacinum]|uniref:Uncharacterized protein n=1 Tax=Purpureocillium lilacinum TaxID=33203 RepID=A0A179HEH2_PURLI|nr:hypothetical protein VFPFJ_06889 [Purpureocillium lilacinum]OAQ88424.1 hypothetical protein VFPFJ_06889 [Purpureocillium lilacinum]
MYSSVEGTCQDCITCLPGGCRGCRPQRLAGGPNLGRGADLGRGERRRRVMGGGACLTDGLDQQQRGHRV